jgi:hypothetical protein
MEILSGPVPVEDFFKTPIPQEVWHYTTLAGFEGILSSGKIWATEAHFTTDTSEFVHAREVAVRFLESITPSDAHTSHAKKAGLEMVRFAFDSGVLSPEFTEVYLASFSASADLKSQWIEYAGNGLGVSLAFNLGNVRPPSDLKLGITVAPCIYVNAEKEKLLKAALSHFVDAVARLDQQTQDTEWIKQQLRDWNMLDRIFGLQFDRPAFDAEMASKFRTSLREANNRTSFDLLRLASHCKNHCFYQEEEWRLALPRAKKKPFKYGEVLYRGPQRNIPYVESNLFQQVKLPITQVMAGPLCEDFGKIQEILTKWTYDVPISKSSIPLRNSGM